jgi:DNA polymerase-3 subunit gamma/tau
MLSSGAFNALLKILEEPPQQVIFILATTELHKVPLTIRSRCLTFLFKKIDTQLIVQNMEKILNKDSIPFEKDALILIARQAQGSLRDSLSLLEQALATSTETILSAKQIKQSLALQGEECAEKLFLFLCEKNLEQSLLLLQQADSTSQDLAILMEQTAQFFRQALIIKNVPQEDQVLQLTQLLKKEYLKMKNTIKEISVAALSEIFRLLVSSAKDLSKSNTSALSWAEMTIIDCISRAQWLSASEILSFFTKKSNQQHSDSAQSIPSNPLSLLRDDSEIIDLPFFKQFISIAEKKSQTLSSRLNHTKIDQFNKNIVQFSETPENESYLSFNEKDLKSFWESIEEIGLQNAEFKGKYTPQKPTLSTPSQKQGRLSVSLSQLNSYEKSQKLLEKEKFLFEQEHMKKLKALATEIKIISTK